MNSYIQISKLNDFLFCPYSVYIHSIYSGFNPRGYHRTHQVAGKIVHETIDRKTYSTSRFLLQGLEVYSEKYNLIGKIDVFDSKKGFLIERKYKIKQIFVGYKFQLYAQMFCLKEMNYKVKKMFLHSLSDNKRYEIPFPNKKELLEFEKLIKTMKEYKPKFKKTNDNKCKNCIYKPLCH